MEKVNSVQVRFAPARAGIRVRLAGLWTALTLVYIYADILGFYTEGVIDDIRSGAIGSVQLSQGFLLAMAAWMTVPAAMVVLSLVLPPRANRWTNIIVAGVSLVVLVASSFAGALSARYLLQALVEATLIVAVGWQAARWPRSVQSAVALSDRSASRAPGAKQHG